MEGQAVELGGRLPRRLLTALIAARGSVVSDERLSELLWGEQKPLQPTAALRAYTSRLRKALGEHHTVLRRHGSGYVLRLGPDMTDSARFISQVRLGREHAAHGRASDAARELTEALSLWRGEPYADLGDVDEIAAARAELTGLREVATEERLAALLVIGEHLDAVSELESVTSRSPYRERLWELLVLGLYRSGRQGDALAALRRARARLAEDLGIDPGPALQQMEQRVLAQDPHLLPAGPAPLVGADQLDRAGEGNGAVTGGSWPISSFVGRDEDMRALADAAATRRLVTLVGPAGVGKTRLATEYLSRRPAGERPWLVRLADVNRGEAIIHAVADAVGVLRLERDPRAALIRALATRSGLLVLDNCEHLIEQAGRLVLDVLTSCPGVRILVTSREPLGLDGEVTVPIGPLPLTDQDGADGPAVTLLLDRVRAVRRGWSPSEQERAAARQVCASLDGLPLALELAAARARVLGLAEIAERIDDSFALLGPVPRGSLTPHTTLSAAIAWSVEQLPDTDRALLSRLWPFEGGFTMEMAYAVQPTGTSMIESLSALVTRSVVIADTTMTPARYRLLHTLRAYCREHDPDPAASRQGHADWVHELVEHCAAESTTSRAGHAMRQLTQELPNLRSAIERDLIDDPPAALRTIGRLNWFWYRGGHPSEALQLLDAALRAAPDAPPLDRGYARLAQIILRPISEDISTVQRDYRDILAWSSAADDHEHRALHGLALAHLSINLIRLRAIDATRDVAGRMITVGRELEQEWLVAGGELALGATLLQQGRSAQGQRALEAAANRASKCGNSWGTGCANLFRGWDTLHDASAIADSHTRGAHALSQLRDAFHAFQADGDQVFALAVLDTAAPALALLGHHHDATRLRAGVAHHVQSLGISADYFHRIGTVIADQTLLPQNPGTPAPAETPPLDWTTMIALLTKSPSTW